MSDVTTFSAQFVLKENLAATFTSMKGKAETGAKELEKVLTNPFEQMEKQLNSMLPTVNKLYDKANRGLTLFSRSELDNAQRYLGQLEAIQRIVSNMQQSPAIRQFSQGISNVQSVLQSTLGLDAVRRNPAPLSQVQYVREFELLAAQTRPWSIYREDESLRQARISEKLNRFQQERMGRASPEWWESKLRQRELYNQQRTGYPVSGPDRGTLSPAARGLFAVDDPNGPNGPNGPNRPRGYHTPQELNAMRRKGEAFLSDVGERKANEASLKKERELNLHYQTRAETLERLIPVLRSLNDQELKNVQIASRAKSEAGRGGDTTLEAANRIIYERGLDPTTGKRFGRTGYSHNLTYGIQNAAFGLEDFLIASQYGGTKAGIRASVNNLTAIMAASTAGLNPFVGGGLIAGTAVLGALAPSVYEATIANMGLRDQDKERDIFAARLKNNRSDLSYNTRINLPYNQTVRDVRSHTSSLIEAEKVAKVADADRRFIEAEITKRTKAITKYEEYTGGGESDLVGGFRNVVLGTGGAIEGYFGFRNTEAQTYLKHKSALAVLNNQVEELKRQGKESEREYLQAQKELKLEEKRYQDSRKYSVEYERSSSILSGQLSGIEQRKINGEFVDPSEEYEARKLDRQRRLLTIGQQYKDPREQQEHMEIIYEEERRDDQLQGIEQARFRKQLQQHNYSIRGDMIGYETHDLKRLEKQLELQRDIISERGDLNPEQKVQMLEAFDKYAKKQMAEAGRYPTLGSVIDVGSAQDVALRQQYFLRDNEENRNPKDPGSLFSKGEEKLGTMITRLEEVRDAIRENKPKVKGPK